MSAWIYGFCACSSDVMVVYAFRWGVARIVQESTAECKWLLPMPQFNSVLGLSAACASRLARRSGMKSSSAMQKKSISRQARTFGPASAARVQVGPLRALPLLFSHPHPPRSGRESPAILPGDQRRGLDASGGKASRRRSAARGARISTLPYTHL